MMLLSFSAVVLGAALQTQAAAPTPAAPMPVTEVMAVVSAKPGVTGPDLMKLIPDEVRNVVQLYLDGKVSQWYTRGDGKGVILFLRGKTVDEAKGILANLPLVKAGYVEVEYIPVGPYTGLRFLTSLQGPADGAAPH